MLQQKELSRRKLVKVPMLVLTFWLISVITYTKLLFFLQLAQAVRHEHSTTSISFITQISAVLLPEQNLLYNAISV